MAGISLITGGKGLIERELNDYYPTPTASTEALLNTYGISREATILDPFAGQGHILNVLKRYGFRNLYGSDLVSYANLKFRPIRTPYNFFTDNYHIKEVDWIITNPPYKQVTESVLKCLDIATKGVAMFLKITFLETVSRYEKIFKSFPPKHVLCFSNRQPMYQNGVVTTTSNAVMYAWFIWEKGFTGDPRLTWINNTDLVKRYKQEGIY